MCHLGGFEACRRDVLRKWAGMCVVCAMLALRENQDVPGWTVMRHFSRPRRAVVCLWNRRWTFEAEPGFQD